MLCLIVVSSRNILFFLQYFLCVCMLVIFKAKRVAETLRAAITGQLRFRQVYFVFIFYFMFIFIFPLGLTDKQKCCISYLFVCPFDCLSVAKLIVGRVF